LRVAILGGTGSFGRALAARLVAAGADEVVIGSRDGERAAAAAAELGGGTGGAVNEEAVRGVELAVLAVKAEAALATAREVAAALEATPLLSVASALSFAKDGVRPDPDARSLAERIQDAVRGPVVAGRVIDAGPLASARTLEGLTAVIVNVNRRYRAHAGIRVTGLEP
jgi:predicted dinucleotide-binding enzyme